MAALEKQFRLKARNTTVGRELLGGVTTFMALSYIVFVQPAFMAKAGVPLGGAFFATCVASAIACLYMAFTANYPIALAPAMGHNAFFTYTICLTLGYDWRQALAAVFIGGSVFVALSFVGFRAKIMELIPENLKRAIAAGIGLLITLIGLEYAGLVISQPGTLIGFGRPADPHTLLALFGLGVTLALLARKVRGAVLFGILITATVGCLVRVGGQPLLSLARQTALADLHPTDTLFKLDFAGLFAHKGVVSGITVILVFLFLDVFDTVGTLIGVSERAGLLEGGRLPRARWALFSDATGTVVGALMGTSTVTSYVESATGVQAGARTGLANVATAGCFLVAILAYPLLGVIGQNVAPEGAQALYPVIAPALIVVGAMMLTSLAKLNWDDPTELLPAFLVLVVMAFAVNITEGIAVGFIAYSLLKAVTGRWRDAHWGFHLISLVLLLRYVFLKV